MGEDRDWAELDRATIARAIGIGSFAGLAVAILGAGLYLLLLVP